MKWFVIIQLLLMAQINAVYGQDERSPLAGWRMADLTQALSKNSPVYPGSAEFRSNTIAKLDNGMFYIRSFTMSEHCGTHVDAPSHKARGGKHIDELEQTHLYGPLVVLDVTHEATENADLVVGVDHIRNHERLFGAIPEGAFVIANTGWWRKWDDKKAYINLGDDGKPHFPGFSGMAAKYLLAERRTIGMGIDTLSTDPGVSTDFPQHQVFLGGGGVNLENLGNLDSVPTRGAFLLVSPFKLKNGSGAPCRVTAFVRLD